MTSAALILLFNGIANAASPAVEFPEATAYVVEPTVVDAGVPTQSLITYRIVPASLTLPNVTFTAPGKTEQRTWIADSAVFSFDQSRLAEASNSIRLTINPMYHAEILAVKSSNITPVASEIATALVNEEGGGIRGIAINHDISEFYRRIVYSVPLTNFSKTIGVGESSVNISNDVNSDDIGLWSERHSYSDTDGSHLDEFMSEETRPTIPQQGKHYKSKNSAVNTFFRPANGLTGIGTLHAITFDSPGGQVVPFNIINRDVDRALE